MKRKATEDTDSHLTKRPAPYRENGDTSSEIMTQAAEALGKWFQGFDDDTNKWRKQAGLDGWGTIGRG